MKFVFTNDQVVLNIVGDRVALGPLRQDMVPLYTAWMNSLPVVRALGMLPGPMSHEAELDFYNQAKDTSQNATFNIYARLEPEEGDTEGTVSWWGIGTCGLREIDHLHRTASFGIMIGETEAWGRGFGTAACRMITEYGFRYQGLNQIRLGVFASNPAGQRAYAKAGYKVVGRRREAHLIGGKLEDEIIMECLASSFVG